MAYRHDAMLPSTLLAPRCQSALTGCAQHTSTRYHSTACWPCQRLRIAIHRRKGTTLKFLFIVVPFLFGECFILFKDREVILLVGHALY